MSVESGSVIFLMTGKWLLNQLCSLYELATVSGICGDGRLPDEVKWFKFSNIPWTKDSKGFLYQVWCASYYPSHWLINRTIQRYPARELHEGTRGDRTLWCVSIKLEHPKVGILLSWICRSWFGGAVEDIAVYQDKEHPEWIYWLKVVNEYVADYSM